MKKFAITLFTFTAAIGGYSIHSQSLQGVNHPVAPSVMKTQRSLASEQLQPKKNQLQTNQLVPSVQPVEVNQYTNPEYSFEQAPENNEYDTEYNPNENQMVSENGEIETYEQPQPTDFPADDLQQSQMQEPVYAEVSPEPPAHENVNEYDRNVAQDHNQPEYFQE